MRLSPVFPLTECGRRDRGEAVYGEIPLIDRGQKGLGFIALKTVGNFVTSVPKTVSLQFRGHFSGFAS